MSPRAKKQSTQARRVEVREERTSLSRLEVKGVKRLLGGIRVLAFSPDAPEKDAIHKVQAHPKGWSAGRVSWCPIPAAAWCRTCQRDDCVGCQWALAHLAEYGFPSQPKPLNPPEPLEATRTPRKPQGYTRPYSGGFRRS